MYMTLATPRIIVWGCSGWIPLIGGVERHLVVVAQVKLSLSAEAVEGLALTLESVDHVEGRNGLATGMLSVGN